MTTPTDEPRPVATHPDGQPDGSQRALRRRTGAPGGSGRAADALRLLWGHAGLLWADVRAAPYRAAIVVGAALLAVVALRDAAGAVLVAYESGNPVLAPLDLVGALLVSLLGYGVVAAVGLLLVHAGAYVLAALLSVGWTYQSRYRRARFRRTLAIVGTVGLALLVVIFARIGLRELAATAVLLGLLAWLTRGRRAMARRNRWLLRHIARAVGERVDDDPRAWRVEADTWDERGALAEARIWYPTAVASSDPNRRAAIERAVTWALRHHPDVEYTVRWEPGRTALRITAQPPLPAYVGDRIWPRLRGGIVVGICAHQDADAIVRGTELGDLGVRLWRPDDERDLLIAGVKGSGKTVLGRGIVVRGLRDGWFPAGCGFWMARAAATTPRSTAARESKSSPGTRTNGPPRSTI